MINVRFTPADLIRGAQQVCVVRLAPAKDMVVAAGIVETVGGKAPADPKLSLNFDPDGELSADDLKAVLPATAAIAQRQAGPVTLEWMDAAGKPASQKVVVKPLTRVTLP